jgi:peroxiredoxin
VSDYIGLPEGLPVPTDDGQADHLLGMSLPSVNLMGTAGSQVHMNAFHNERTIIYVYPMTGRPGVDLPTGWDEIPGARGCTPESCGFRDHFGTLKSLGVANVYGLSNQDTDYQIEAAKRLNLPFELLSDSNQELGKALGLPTFEADGRIFYKRLTMVIFRGRIEKVFYPVFPPDKHAQEVLDWLAVGSK